MKRKFTKGFLDDIVLAAFVIVIGVVFMSVVGCDEGKQIVEPIVDEVVLEPEKEKPTTTVGEVKKPKDPPVPDPTMDTTPPTVVKVGYFKDEQLNEEIVGELQQGDTIFIKVVFSEDMKLVVADDDTARPFLYYQVGGSGNTRFRIAGFGAKGDDFVSGDAKPIGNQKTYMCKYVTQFEDIRSNFHLGVLQQSVDLAGNYLEKSYQADSVYIRKPDPPEVVDISYYYDPQLTDELQATEDNSVGLLHGETIYVKIVFSKEMIAGERDNWTYPSLSYCFGEMVQPGGWTSILTRGKFVVKPYGGDPADLRNLEVQPLEGTNNIFVAKFIARLDSNLDMLKEERSEVCVSYHNGIRHVKLVPSSGLVLYLREDLPTPTPDFPPPYRVYLPPESNPGDFVGRVCMPVDDEWSALDYVAPVAGVTVTISEGAREGEYTITDAGGYYLFPNIAGDEIYLRVEQEYIETKDVIVHRFHHTTLQEIPPNRVFDPSYYEHTPQNIPGMILVGMPWPLEVRFLLDEIPLPHELICRLRPIGSSVSVGSYAARRMLVSATIENTVGHTGTLFHEIAHARQHAVAILNGFDPNPREWEKTPEGKAYAEAAKKDLEEVGFEGYGYTTQILFENAADLCSNYWFYYQWRKGIGPLERMPNRFKWAQEWLHKQY